VGGVDVDGNDGPAPITNDQTSDRDQTTDEVLEGPELSEVDDDVMAPSNITDVVAPSPTGKRPSKHIKKKNMDPGVLEIRRRIQECCKNNDLVSAMEAYDEANRQAIRLEAQSFYSLLNLCGGLDKGVVHIGTPKGPMPVTENDHSNEHPNTNHSPSFIDWGERQKLAFRVKDHMEQNNLALNETAYSAIVKILCRNKEFETAERVLDEAETVQQCKPKLRLYSSLIIAYCQEGRMIDALKCWRRLKRHPGLDLTERESLYLMRCATSTGDSLVMQQVLTNLADDVPIPSKDVVAAIIEWFEIKHSQHTESLTRRHADDAHVRDLLEEINNNNNSTAGTTTTTLTETTFEPPPLMGPVVDTRGWTISSACHVDSKSGLLKEGCLAGHHLQPVYISDRVFHEMQKMNESIVLEGKVDGHNSEFQGGRKGRKRMDFSVESRKEEWKRLSDLLDSKMAGNAARGPVEVVIDGANVGYFKQNFTNAPRHVDYEQIDWVVRKFLVEKKQRVLVVMHNRHFSNNLLPPQYRPLCDAWQREGLLFRTPPGMNDDWFWMHAALKYRTFVVTNDEMRDHHFQMLAPRFFLRWKDRHQIHFDFGEWRETTSSVGGVGNDVYGRNDTGGRQREVLLTYPDVYSRKVQRVADGLVVPLAKRGDENRFLDGCHVASEDEPVDETYLCIRPNGTSEDSMFSELY
jgi:ribonuclease P protein 3